MGKSLQNIKLKHFILDVDGVLTDGKFLYSSEGKIYKTFGPHDSDGLKLICAHIQIEFISADKRGFLISKKRVEDMGFKIKLVSENNRYNYVKEYGFKNTIYMGDGIYDADIIRDVAFGIAPKNAREEAKKYADFITENNSSEGAVLDACLEIKKKFIN
tara:strand:+ start:1210 stop:1686 length:477 start_codon:yes stop_codon:yes gene_type:complete